MTTAPDADVYLEPQAAALPHAEPSLVTSPFWAACRRSVLLYQRCGHCRAAAFPPAELCRECLARELRWERSAGHGTLYSWTIVHRPATPAFATPYAPAIVTLAEGYQMLTNIINVKPGQLRLDLPVRVTFIDVSAGLVLPYFEPAAAGRINHG
jgi:uncharacterized OB-fold protein